MKRSEMVDHIAEKLLELYGGDKEECEEVRKETKMSRLKFAHKALQAAEEKGMTPPTRPWIVPATEEQIKQLDNYMGVILAGQIVEVNKWDEDLEKT